MLKMKIKLRNLLQRAAKFGIQEREFGIQERDHSSEATNLRRKEQPPLSFVMLTFLCGDSLVNHRKTHGGGEESLVP